MRILFYSREKGKELFGLTVLEEISTQNGPPKEN